jgi:predicted DNA-binding transcriptional regulator YafY
LEIFDALAKATAKHQQLALTYRKPASKQAEVRVVDPYHLANVNGEWFLFAYDHLRKDIRTFVPARIKKIEHSGQIFQMPAKFSLEKMLHNSFGIHSGQGDFNVAIRFSAAAADYIREKRWHPSQRIRELKDGGLELRMRLSSLGEVERWILGWGGNAKVLQPPQLVDSVRAAAERIISNSSK